MTFAEAAVVVLRQAAEPLHFREITDRAIAQDLVEVTGSTPWHSMNGALRRWIRSEGAEAPIVSLGDGYFALRAWGLPVPEEGRALESEAEDTVDSEIPGEITVNPRPSDISPVGWKWHQFNDRMRQLVAKVPRHPSLAHAFVSFRSLFVWSAASFAAGVGLRLGRRSKLLAAVSQQLIGWGGAGSAMSLRGMYEAQRYDQAVFAGSTNRRMLSAHVSGFQRLFRGLLLGGIVTGLLGWMLRQASDERPRVKGTGIGLLVQGAVLGVVGGLAAWTDPDRASSGGRHGLGSPH
ncbi:MAG: winged helix-turn-helix domain-containing protein [Anaerolineae bacterium]